MLTLPLYRLYKTGSGGGGDSNWILTSSACSTKAKTLGLAIGGGGYPFEGSWGAAEAYGCFAYSSSSKDFGGNAYFGTGGSTADMEKTLTLPLYRL